MQDAHRMENANLFLIFSIVSVIFSFFFFSFFFARVIVIQPLRSGYLVKTKISGDFFVQLFNAVVVYLVLKQVKNKLIHVIGFASVQIFHSKQFHAHNLSRFNISFQ